ncbi:RNI-like protein [Xylariaceae sp. FL0594]|nr:RNI-like protein [Xylariaceae sp. FL0594]
MFPSTIPDDAPPQGVSLPASVSSASEVSGPATPTNRVPKDKRRQRFMRGLKRMSSSPALPHFGRLRSPSTPYDTRNSLSCMSLVPVVVGSGDCPSGSEKSVPATPNCRPVVANGVESLPSRYKTAAVTATAAALSPEIHHRLSEGVVSRLESTTKRQTLYDYWTSIPYEIRIQILSYLKPRELIRISRTCQAFHALCFDGQLWTRLDATDFYTKIPAQSLANLVTSAGPFIRDLNVRGCIQIEHYKRAEVLASACQNLTDVSLEGCRNFSPTGLHSLIRSNTRLIKLNLAGIIAVTNNTCKIISRHCTRLERLNISWCTNMDAKGVKMVIRGCPELRDLRAGEIKGFGKPDTALAMFQTNKLERLILSGCSDLSDDSLKIMARGPHPEIDILSGRPILPARKLRHLDLSRCSRLTDVGVQALGYVVPELEGLQLNGCTELTDFALEPILASAPNLTHLELDELRELTDGLMSNHLAKAPCARRLEHLSVSSCEGLGDAGMLPVMENCVSLKRVEMDNTQIGNLILTQAASLVRARSSRSTDRGSRPRSGLRLVVYDCHHITWTGVREILFRNAEIRRPSGAHPTYPAEIISLKCYYGWQQTVDQHTLRVLRGDFESAARLEAKWGDYMQALSEVGAGGAGLRRRRRRAREARLQHANEEGLVGRPRSRTLPGSCSVM